MPAASEEGQPQLVRLTGAGPTSVGFRRITGCADAVSRGADDQRHSNLIAVPLQFHTLLEI